MTKISLSYAITYKIKLVVLFNLLLFSSVIYADSPLKFHAAYGAGLRYAGASFPLPLLNVNVTRGNSTIFSEAVVSPFIITGNIGYAHKISHQSGLHVAALKGAIGVGGNKLSGFKLGYTYNSNEYNGRGWETTVELYSVTETFKATFDTASKTPKDYLLPSISFGYHW